MRLLRKLRIFHRIDGADRLLILEAIAMLGLARLLVVTTPFRLIAPWLERAPESDFGDNALVAVPRFIWARISTPRANSSPMPGSLQVERSSWEPLVSTT